MLKKQDALLRPLDFPKALGALGLVRPSFGNNPGPIEQTLSHWPTFRSTFVMGSNRSVPEMDPAIVMQTTLKRLICVKHEK